MQPPQPEAYAWRSYACHSPRSADVFYFASTLVCLYRCGKLLANHQSGHVGIRAWDSGHDGGVRNVQVLNTAHAAACIDDRRRVICRAHPACPTHMECAGNVGADMLSKLRVVCRQLLKRYCVSRELREAEVTDRGTQIKQSSDDGGVPRIRGGFLVEPAQSVGEADRKRPPNQRPHALRGEEIDHKAKTILHPREIAFVIYEVELDQRSLAHVM